MRCDSEEELALVIPGIITPLGEIRSKVDVLCICLEFIVHQAGVGRSNEDGGKSTPDVRISCHNSNETRVLYYKIGVWSSLLYSVLIQQEKISFLRNLYLSNDVRSFRKKSGL